MDHLTERAPWHWSGPIRQALVRKPVAQLPIFTLLIARGPPIAPPIPPPWPSLMSDHYPLGSRLRPIMWSTLHLRTMSCLTKRARVWHTEQPITRTQWFNPTMHATSANPGSYRGWPPPPQFSLSHPHYPRPITTGQKSRLGIVVLLPPIPKVLPHPKGLIPPPAPPPTNMIRHQRTTPPASESPIDWRLYYETCSKREIYVSKQSPAPGNQHEYHGS